MTAAITFTDSPVLRTAHGLVTDFLALVEAQPRTKAAAVAKARFDGAVETLFRLGFGPTPFAIHMAVADAIREHGARPAFHFAGSNDEVFAWDRAVAGAVVAALNIPVL